MKQPISILPAIALRGTTILPDMGTFDQGY